MAIANNFVEDAFLWNKIALLFHDEWACLAELDIIPDFRIALSWYAIRIAGGKLDKIKFIAA
ncbi:MAG: hypothetical protein SFX19_03605 [Alphaproteobacteria bacterium]|nr:hypothetical protein [Alphaproteobacteria bacterium]